MKMLSEFTRQEMFDAAWEGFEQQGWKTSSTPKGSCLYRGPNGTRCAIGHLIPDQYYAKNYEGKSIFEVTNTSAKARPYLAGLNFDQLNFLANMQSAHDNIVYYNEGKGLKEKMIAFAETYDLKVKENND